MRFTCPQTKKFHAGNFFSGSSPSSGYQKVRKCSTRMDVKFLMRKLNSAQQKRVRDRWAPQVPSSTYQKITFRFHGPWNDNGCQKRFCREKQRAEQRLYRRVMKMDGYFSLALSIPWKWDRKEWTISHHKDFCRQKSVGMMSQRTEKFE